TAHVHPREIDAWIAELNAVYPALALSAQEVTFANCGLVPFGDTATETELSFGKESRITDHHAAHGISGLVSLVGIRFTTARGDAARALELLLRQERQSIAPADADRPLSGGGIEDFAAFESHALRAKPAGLSDESVRALVRNHGTLYGQVVRRVVSDQPGTNMRGGATIPGTATLLAEVQYAVDEEMAMKLEDIVMRRTDLAAGCAPGRVAIEIAAHEMARRLRWSQRRLHEEIAATERTLARHLARPSRSRQTPAHDLEPKLARGSPLAESYL
ncbi:MAG: glycerol-3-phosphate dehydrogenase C-terminal domain-containing protein, partial [Steroidobacteraceae bacterium]